MEKHRKAKEAALMSLRKMVDDEDMKGFPAGDQGVHNPLEKSGFEGEVTQKQYFSEGGEVKGKKPEYRPDGSKDAMASEKDVGSGDHDESSGDEFAKAWEELKGSKMKRPGMDDEGLGGEDYDDGSGEDAAADSGELSDEEKEELKKAYNRHILGKR